MSDNNGKDKAPTYKFQYVIESSIDLKDISEENISDAGAFTVKWTKKMLRYTKTIVFWVKDLNVVAKCNSNWVSFHHDLCCCVEYSNIENQVEIFNNYH